MLCFCLCYRFWCNISFSIVLVLKNVSISSVMFDKVRFIVWCLC